MKKHFTLFVYQHPGAHSADVYRFERRQRKDGTTMPGEPKVELLASLRMNESGELSFKTYRRTS